MLSHCSLRHRCYRAQPFAGIPSLSLQTPYNGLQHPLQQMAVSSPTYTSLTDLPEYTGLPPNVQEFASNVAIYSYKSWGLCKSHVSEIATASCLAQWPDMSQSLMASASAQDSVWTDEGLSDPATLFIPSVTNAYSAWLGQAAVQTLVTPITGNLSL